MRDTGPGFQEPTLGGKHGNDATHGEMPPMSPDQTPDPETDRAPDTAMVPEARFAQILAIADDAIISVDAEQRITLFNQGAERVFGYAASEVLGAGLDRLLPERVRAAHRGHVDAFGRAPETARVMAVRGKIFGCRKNGEEFPAEASISKLREGGQTVFTVILRDISERRRADEQLRRAHDELELRVQERTAELVAQNQRLEEEIRERRATEARLAQRSQELARSNADLEQFAYVASHDLQEPLRMVASYAQLLARRYQGRLDGDADDFIGYVVDGARRMQQLINDLLSFSRVGTRGKAFTPTDCAVVIRTVLDNLSVALEESGGSVRYGPLPTLPVDDTQLAMLLQNLIGNALKFRRAEPPTIRIEAQRTGDEWMFSVADNGIGIEAQYAERIFVIFQRLHTKADYPGTGIGLAICKKIVERHGGRIWVESQPGQGSTFFFTLPEPEDSVHEPTALPNPHPAG